MREPLWLSRYEIDRLHELLIVQFGGSHGVRDRALIDSALARPTNRWHYDPDADLASLAASYAYGLSQNHGYVDGNKRIAFIAATVFLHINGQLMEASETEAYYMMLEVASGEKTEAELADWLREHLIPLDES